MGNSETKNKQYTEAKTHTINPVPAQKKKHQIKEQSLIDEIELQPSRPVQQQKTIQINLNTQSQKKAAQNENRKSTQKLNQISKELPPLKFRNSRVVGAPLENCENTVNQPNVVDDLEQICYEKNTKNQQTSAKVVKENQGDDQQRGENQKQNLNMNARPKKFRPSEAGRKNTSS